MVLLARKRQIAIKAETTEGTAISVAAADAARNCFEANFAPEIEQFTRDPFRSTIGALPTLPGVRTGRITYRTELAGAGDTTPPIALPPFAVDLEACGFERISARTLAVSGITGTFLTGETITGGTSGATATVRIPNWAGNTDTLVIQAISGTFTSETITGGTSAATATAGGASVEAGYLWKPSSTFTTPGGPGASHTVVQYHDGTRHELAGCRGTFTLRASTGQPVQLSFDFLGPLGPVTDVAMLSGITFPTTVPPRLLDSELYVGAYKLIYDSIELTPGNDLQVRRNANSVSGVISTRIVARQGSGSIDPEKTLVATEDFYGKLAAASTFPINMELGKATPGNRFFVHCPRVIYRGMSEGDRGLVTVMQADLGLNEYLGDDELIIAAV